MLGKKFSPEVEAEFREIESQALDVLDKYISDGMQCIVATTYMVDRRKLYEKYLNLGHKCGYYHGSSRLFLAGCGSDRISFVSPRIVAHGWQPSDPVCVVVTNPIPYCDAKQIAYTVGTGIPCFITYRRGTQLNYIRQGLDRTNFVLMRQLYSGEYIGNYP